MERASGEIYTSDEDGQGEVTGVSPEQKGEVKSSSGIILSRSISLGFIYLYYIHFISAIALS